MGLDLSTQLFTAIIVMLGAMSVLWVVQWLFRNAGLVEAAWAAGLGALALFYGCTSDGNPERRVLLAGLTCGWAFRLAVHLFNDRILGKPEDGRYQMMRNRMGDRVQHWFFVYYLMHAAVAILFSLPILAVARNEAVPGGYDLLAILVWAVAFLGECVADAQLARFRANPANKGTTCKAGLWRFSRHPNYFFEWIHWFTYVLLAWNAGSGWWWVTVIFGPVMMLVFLLRLTGVPYAEAQALRSRADYAGYQRTTSQFVPWFPRSSAVQPVQPVQPPTGNIA